MDENENIDALSGPVPVPSPLGETPAPVFQDTSEIDDSAAAKTPIAPNAVSKGFAPLATTLSKGAGTVGQAIGTGNKRTVTDPVVDNNTSARI
tara:strand:+ start:90 stop:368 length:279 start_codon:yes stop_codon:yes gene_type:complete